MDTLDSLMRKGYRIYKIKVKLDEELKNYFRYKMGLFVDYHEELKVTTVRDAKSKSAI